MQNKDLQRRLNGIERTLKNQVIFNKAVLTIDETPSYLGITKRHLNELIKLKVIPFHFQFGHIYFKKAELDSWMIGGGVGWFSPGFWKNILKLLPWLSLLIKFFGSADN